QEGQGRGWSWRGRWWRWRWRRRREWGGGGGSGRGVVVVVAAAATEAVAAEAVGAEAVVVAAVEEAVAEEVELVGVVPRSGAALVVVRGSSNSVLGTSPRLSSSVSVMRVIVTGVIPPDPGIGTAALGACETAALSGAAAPLGTLSWSGHGFRVSLSVVFPGLSLLFLRGQDLPVSLVSRGPSGLPPLLPVFLRQRLLCRRFTWTCGAWPASVDRVTSATFLLVVDDYSRFTTVFPFRSKGDVTEGREFSSGLLRAYCRAEGIRQTFTLPDSPQQNGIAERRIGMVRDVARTSMMHAAAPHFLWPFVVRYAAHHINLQTRGFPAGEGPYLPGPAVDWEGWQFYHPSSRHVLSSQDVTFDELVPFYRLFPYCTPSLPPPLGLPYAVKPVKVAGDSGTAAGAEPGGADSGGAVRVCAEPGVADSGGAAPEGVEPGGAASGAAEPGGAARVVFLAAGGVLLELELLRPLRVLVPAGPAAAGPADPTGAGAAEGVGAETAPVCPGGGPAAGAAGGPAIGGVVGAGAAAEGAGAVPGVSAVPARPRPYFVPLLQQPTSSPASPVRASRASGRSSRQHPPPVPGTHRMSLRPSTAPLRAPLPSPPEYSLPALPDPESDSLRAASPTVTRLLASVVTDSSFESTAASALVVV
ncbi:unnamed protein product, partial [Closterium sp. NIES-65]